MTDLVKTAATYLRTTIKSEYGEEVRSSHAHASVAAFLGYKSKKALLADEFDSENKHILVTHDIDLDSSLLDDTISRMKETPLKGLPSDDIAEIIQAGLTTECEQCGDKSINSSPLYPEDFMDGDEPDGQVCDSCDQGDEYATCIYCGDGIVYRAEQINSDGECPEHEGESFMTEEEREGWESYIEYHQKN